jgi:hypothetical protein
MGLPKYSKPLLLNKPATKRGDEDDSDHEEMKAAQRLHEYNRFRLDPPKLNEDGTE